MKAFFYTFGCKVNQYETENIKQQFLNAGYEITSEADNADICVINSCTVTSTSDKKNRQFIHKIKKENENCIIVLTGCFPQAFKEKAEQLYEVDIITGSSNKTKIINLVDEFFIHHQRIIRIDLHEKDEKFEDMQNTEYANKTRAYVKIQDGCDQYCTYCIIPYARGHIRSKPLENIIKEVELLSNSGHKEIVLVGINLCCYGKELNLRLVDAVEAACSVKGIERVRLSSIEPEMISDDDIKRMSSLKNLCPHFHLSLQSGCDKTLKDMNRKYNSEEFYALVCKLRNAFEDCAITTDIMVGFPDETDEDFNDSLEFVKKVGFSKVHVFPYSKREGTVAFKKSNQISKSVKDKRAKIMTDECAKISEQIHQKMVGKVYPVLFEAENSPNYHHGYTPNYTLVQIPTKNDDKSLRRKIFYVKIIKVEKNYCIGELANI